MIKYLRIYYLTYLLFVIFPFLNLHEKTWKVEFNKSMWPFKNLLIKSIPFIKSMINNQRLKKMNQEIISKISLNNKSLLFGLLLSLLSLWLLLFLGGSSFFFKLFQSIHCHLGSCGNTCGELISSSSKWNLASSALPDSQCNSSDWSLHYDDGCTFPHAGQTYLACCWSSNFLTIFLMAPPYLVPYFPTIPTFFVLLAIMDFNYLIYYFSYLLFYTQTFTFIRLFFY